MSGKNVKLLVALKNIVDIVNICDDEEQSSERRYWVKPFLQNREIHSLESHLLKDILWDSKDYKNFCRLNVESFEVLLGQVHHKIKKQNTVMRTSISSRIRLAITLRFLATGDSYRSLEYLSRVSRKTISKFVPEVLEAIVEALRHDHLKTPSTQQEWKAVAEGFNSLWQFPHTLGAIDGKHIRIKNPQHAGSNFYNYKGFFSTVLLAVVDANSKFIYIDVGGNGRASDVVVLKNSSLQQAMNQGKLNFPDDEALPGQVAKTSYFFIGDDIFGLDRNMMKAYNRNRKLTTPEEIFNYRLSRARMTVEMAFGRLANRFRIFHRPIEVDLLTTDKIVQTCCVLHNFLTKSSFDFHDEHNLQLPQTMTPLPSQEHDTV
ncbi:uncharacterized protein LOC135950730 [Calliphora vicina]|uniref:uncharacterized protein LOC135950730 n=1 Tax=Calliphora vicina TaxID=7373 RepID=UPI00325B481A